MPVASEGKLDLARRCPWGSGVDCRWRGQGLVCEDIVSLDGLLGRGNRGSWLRWRRCVARGWVPRAALLVASEQSTKQWHGAQRVTTDKKPTPVRGNLKVESERTARCHRYRIWTNHLFSLDIPYLGNLQKLPAPLEFVAPVTLLADSAQFGRGRCSLQVSGHRREVEPPPLPNHTMRTDQGASTHLWYYACHPRVGSPSFPDQI